MFSRNQDEVEVVKNELLKAGISSEIRREPMSEAMGVNAVELWVPDPRNFFNASKFYGRLKAGGTPAEPGTEPQGEVADQPVETAKPDAEQDNSPPPAANRSDLTQTDGPCRQGWKQAGSLLEKGIAEMFRLEGELTTRCASLENKVEELSQALAQEQAALAREKEGQVAAEKAKAERISALLTIMERERQQWQEQLKRRDDSLKGTQEKLYSISRLLQTKEAAAEALKKKIVTLELQQQENKVLLSNARSEAMADREARIAAEESARKLGSAQQSLEKERLKYKELEQQMQAHVTGLTSLFRKLDTADSRISRR
jgi:hypothetical protein